MMTRRKKTIYAVALIFSATIMGIYCTLVLHASRLSTRERLENELRSTSDLLGQSIAEHAQEILFHLDAYADTQMNADDIAMLLQTLETLFPERHFRIALRTGDILGGDGLPVGTLPDLQPLHDARRLGFSVIRYTAGKDYLATIVPMPGHPAYYLLQMESAESFLLRLQAVFPIPAAYSAVYSESGAQVSGYFWGNETDSYELSQSVQHGASDYVARRGGAIQQQSLHRGYNLYIPLNQPNGWFVGARVPASWAGSTDSEMVRVHLLVLLFWAAGMALLFAVDACNDRLRRETIATLCDQDPLTRLTNATGMEKATLAYFQDHPIGEYSMVLMDITAFHRINALYGHAAGDSLLCLVAGVLREHAICPARFYGDVFAFLSKSSLTLADDLERELFSAINKGFGKPYRNLIRFKFGIYPIQNDGRGFRQIIDGAQLALRDAKTKPERSQVVYDSHLQTLSDMKRNIEANMLHALSQKEFLVYIQPQVQVRTGECCGGEALVRWQSHELGFLPPDSFVPLFETNGFIMEIDLYMLEQTMEILHRQLQAGFQPLPISVNMSRVTITFPNFLERLEALVEQAPVPLHYLKIEITESALERNRDSVVPLMHALKRFGFQVALDDFGSGFSSLISLRDLPVDILKIDRAFFQESETSDKTRKIISNILNMASELEIGVVCEGVENEPQAAFLRRSGDIVAQGYYYSEPIPYERFESDYLAVRTPSLL